MGSPAFSSLGCFLLLLWSAGAACWEEPFNVSYDQRAIVINGQRRMLISAGIHYPRATPEMWPEIIAKAKEGGADVIESYVFWDGHEPARGQYYFSGRYNIVKFIKHVEEAGLYMFLRIGPYACAEWNFGGFPVWLRDIEGIVFRTNNAIFQEEMSRFVTKVVNMLKEERLFPSQGGPIILAQIENEYGNIEHSFGEGGKQYVKWAANLAKSFDVGIPWVMCQQNDAPIDIIDACNGYYCDGFNPNSPTKPKIWTEDWNGWYMIWGNPIPHRPVEDDAFAVARFFQRGGCFQNYYMFFGGTNFGHTAGGPFVATSYDYDAPIDEYGLIRQPKWGHLKDLHAAIKLCEPALVAVDKPTYIKLGSQQEAHVYQSSSKGVDLCAAFLANIDSRLSSSVHFQGKVFNIPPWSVSILPDCKHVVFNTAKVRAQTSLAIMQRYSNVSSFLHDDEFIGEAFKSDLKWFSYKESIGIWSENIYIATTPLEHVNLTKDSTDYLWYTCRVNISKNDAETLQETSETPVLYIHEIRDMITVYVNGELSGSVKGSWWVNAQLHVPLQAGWNDISILSSTVGLQNYGAFMEQDGAGLSGPIMLKGLPSGDIDLSTIEWVHQVGFRGESLKVFTEEGQESVEWTATTGLQLENTPFTWYKTSFDAPNGDDPVALDLVSMGKGEAWINGQSIGRYWPIFQAKKSGCQQTCDYRGAYNANKCLTGCGQPTQRWYHIPRAWLKPKNNLLVLFEEIGGDLSQVGITVREPQSTICAHVSESHPSLMGIFEEGEMGTTKIPPNAQIQCGKGNVIHKISFASFGTPQGQCGKFSYGTCHSPLSLSVVEEACVGQRSCFLPVDIDIFGHDPCNGVEKSLAMQAECIKAESFIEQLTSTYDN